MAKTIKKLIKHIIQYNIFDYFIPRLRKFYRKIGILEFMDERFYWFAWKLVRIAKRKLWPGKITGTSKIPNEGAAIFVPNHSHALDPFLSASQVHRKVHWVSKMENYKYPFFRPILQMTGSIPLRRGVSDQNAIRLIKKELDRGEIVGMFPEGTRTKDGKLRRFHTGAARLCIEYGIPYIPVGIRNSFKLEVGRNVEVHVGKPRYPDPSWKLNYENAKKFTELMRKDIAALSLTGEPESVKLYQTEEIYPAAIKKSPELKN